MSNKEVDQKNKHHEPLARILPSRKLAERTRQSLFTRRMQNQQLQFEQIEKRYFPYQQVQRLAGFLELPDVKLLSVEEALECYLADHYKAELQQILKCFISGQFDAIKTAKRLDSFLIESKPQAWQLWRVFDFSRYKHLTEFVEGFKAACLKEVLQRNRGYRGAADVHYESRGRYASQTAANHTDAIARLVSALNPQEQKQHDSLFLKGYTGKASEPEVCYTEPNNEVSLSGSFFKRPEVE